MSPWTFHEEATLRQMQGKTHAEIAAALHRTESSVKAKALHLGLLPAGPDAWTEERVAEFRKLHAEGLSYGAIAKSMGITRNAAIGKGHRLGLTDDPVRRAIAKKRLKIVEARQAGKRALAPAPHRRPGKFTVDIVPTITAPLPPAVAPAAVPFAPSNPVSILAVGFGQCRFIITEGVFPAMCCGEPTDGGSWCKHCAKKVFAPRVDRHRRAA